MRILVLFFCLLAVNPASAEQLPRETVEEFSRLIHNNMAGAALGSNHIISEEEAKGLPYPLVPYDLREETIMRGFVSGMAEVCGLDWEKKNFEPFMDKVRAIQPRLNDYQIAFTGILHGYSMQNAVNSGKNKGGCDDVAKQNIASQLMAE